MVSASAAWIAVLLFAGTMIYAGVKDVATMTISNRLVVFLTIAYMVFASAAGVSFNTVSMSALTALVALGCTFALFTQGWIGGGDAKLIPVAVLWLGHHLALEFFLYASVFGAVLTLAILQFRNFALPPFLAKAEWPRRVHQRKSGIPYGAALAMAALSLLPASHWSSILMQLPR